MSTHPPSPAASLSLVHTTLGDLVQLGPLVDPPVSTTGNPLGLREGEVVQCLRNDSYGVLVARGDGTRVLVPLTGARQVSVRWFPGLHEPDEPGADRGPEVALPL
jgi:hypothetical protein